MPQATASQCGKRSKPRCNPRHNASGPAGRCRPGRMLGMIEGGYFFFSAGSIVTTKFVVTTSMVSPLPMLLTRAVIL